MSRALRRETHHRRLVWCRRERPTHLDELLREAVRRAPGREAVIAGASVLTYADLDRRVDRTAAFLAENGLRRGERIGLLIGNRPEFVVAFLAAVRLGAIAVPMNIRQRAPETAYMLEHCEAAMLVYEADCAGEIPARAELPMLRAAFVVGGEPRDGDRALGEGVASLPGRAASDEDDPVCLLYTSGTTGRPKGAILTHLGCIHSALNYTEAFDLREGDRSALAVPVSHVTGLIAILLVTLHVAGTTVIVDRFRARDFVALAERERIAYTLMVPAMYKLCLMESGFARADLSHWRIGGFGGAPIAPAVIDELAAAVPHLRLFNIYGATETSSPVTMLDVSAGGPERSVGTALPCADLLIVDPSGRELPPGEQGELLIGGPMVISGYWNNAAANADSFIGGYWRSGDVASIDPGGYVTIHDRMKDVINRGGYKIYCLEVENVLMRFPGIAECAVVGVPDEVLGERVRAVLHGIGRGSIEDVRAWCASQLSDYKVPQDILVLPEPLPRNANGKILKQALRELVA